MTTCMWKVGVCYDEPRELLPNSAVLHSSTEHFSIFQLISLFVYGLNFIGLVQSHRCH